MEYRQDIVINKPLDEVVKLFDNPDNLKKWQPSLTVFEPLEGEPGSKGATTKIVFRMGKKDCEMVETILERDLPRVFSATYDTKGVYNRVDNYFTAVGDGQTQWTTENEFQFTSLGMKLMGLLMKKAFPKQTMKNMQQFKAFAESSPDLVVAHEEKS